ENPYALAPWEQLEAFLGQGCVKPDWIHHAMEYEAAVVELLETGILGDHNLTVDCYFDPPYHCSSVAAGDP
ncbi:hypothetical protein HK102_011844, partial [Quaeritorhiza haematococci]